jgi:hypothetical protein
MRVVADTSIFNHLILLGQLDLLPTLSAALSNVR